MDEAVAVVPHRPRWADQGAGLVAVLARALAPHARDVQHVGSTAVPGLAAKPVLDLAAAVTPDRWPVAVQRLLELGFQDLGEAGVTGRRYLRRRASLPHANVHLLAPGGPLWTDVLLLRDHLRARPEAAARYGAAKREAADRHPRLLAYSAAKAAVVEQLLAQARGERPGG